MKTIDPRVSIVCRLARNAIKGFPTVTREPVSLAVTREEINALARVLNSAHSPEFLAAPADLAIRDNLLSQLVGRAAISLGSPWPPEVTAVVERDYRDFCRRQSQPSTSKRQRASRK